MATARILPHKRKLEEAFVGVLLDAQRVDPTVLAGLTIVCGATGRSPDDPQAGLVAPTEPELPYLAVSCGKLGADPDMPQSTGIKHADLLFHVKTQSNDEGRALADQRLAELEYILEDVAPILAALNMPAGAGTPDTRRVKELYVYDFFNDDQASAPEGDTWIDQIGYVVVTQGFDPDNNSV